MLVNSKYAITIVCTYIAMSFKEFKIYFLVIKNVTSWPQLCSIKLFSHIWLSICNATSDWPFFRILLLFV